MCTIIVARNVLAGQPLLIAHDRDELLARSATPPVRRAGVLAPRDALAGGTWIGVNAHGLVAAVTNRIVGPRALPEAPAPSSPPRSRGLLCLDALAESSVAAALSLLRPHLAATPYQGFNLLLVERHRAVVLMRDTDLEAEVEIEDGVHIITSMDHLDPPALLPLCAELAEAARRGDFAAALRRTLAQHEPLPTNYPVCKHMGPYGTGSATLLVLDEHGEWRMRFAAGPPCRHELRDVEPTR